jgi:tetratricopeptide (TPR) repeat protein
VITSTVVHNIAVAPFRNRSHTPYETRLEPFVCDRSYREVSRGVRTSLSACTVVAFVALVSPARAGGAEDTKGSSGSVAAKPLERARVRYREGVEAYKEGHFRDAIDLFLEADQLAPSAALSFNIGAAYEKLGEPAAALRWYRDYLRRAPDSADRTQVETLVSGFEHALQSSGVQQMTVNSTPDGAELAVDGQSVGVTPFTLEIAPGSHVLSLKLAGRAPASRTIDLPADHAIDVAVELAPEEIQESNGEPQAAPVVPTAAAAATTKPHDAGSNDGKLLTTFGWVGIAAGGAALGGALVFELLRQGAESDAKGDRTQVGYADKLDTMYGRQTAARVMLGVGAGLAATGGVLLWFGRSRGSAPQTALGVTCGPGACGSSLHGRF